MNKKNVTTFFHILANSPNLITYLQYQLCNFFQSSVMSKIKIYSQPEERSGGRQSAGHCPHCAKEESGGPLHNHPHHHPFVVTSGKRCGQGRKKPNCPSASCFNSPPRAYVTVPPYARPPCFKHLLAVLVARFRQSACYRRGYTWVSVSNEKPASLTALAKMLSR